ncbi:hypothetical protein [Paraglaciecola aestuariivivens]
MSALNSTNSSRVTLPAVALASASVFVANGANAAIISQTDLNQEVLPGEVLTNIGGVTGLTIDYTVTTTFSSNVKSELRSDSIANSVVSHVLPGTTIGPATVFTTAVPLTIGSGPAPVTDFTKLFGFKFGSDLNPKFGWIKINIVNGDFTDPNPLASVFVDSWGYETEAGKSIVAGATDVNAPTGLALLALGAAGIAVSRRRKTTQVNA